MTHSCREYLASDKGSDHKAARQSKTARATTISRVGRSWVDGNGTEQHWTACSEIHHLAWMLKTEHIVGSKL